LTGCTNTPVEPGPEVPVAPVAAKPGPPEGIQPGETLDVFVMEDDSFSGTYKVRSTGHIIVPKLGRVKVGGLSASGAESALTEMLTANKLTKATVLVDRADLARTPGSRPTEFGGTEVFISGKVNHPGRYSVTGIGNAPPTVHQAILQAGGCGRFAHQSKVHVLRRSAGGLLRRIDADLPAIESGSARDVPLAPGDIIVVPEKKVDFGL
jgi:protein involved in polysaccharide export with SLBB domain